MHEQIDQPTIWITHINLPPDRSWTCNCSLAIFILTQLTYLRVVLRLFARRAASLLAKPQHQSKSSFSRLTSQRGEQLCLSNQMRFLSMLVLLKCWRILLTRCNSAVEPFSSGPDSNHVFRGQWLWFVKPESSRLGERIIKFSTFRSCWSQWGLQYFTATKAGTFRASPHSKSLHWKCFLRSYWGVAKTFCGAHRGDSRSRDSPRSKGSEQRVCIPILSALCLISSRIFRL